ncbi:MAG: hypothetical protein V4695_01195 [Pseudomonadota bacterium]
MTAITLLLAGLLTGAGVSLPGRAVESAQTAALAPVSIPVPAVRAFIGKTERLLFQATGDLNQDGYPDTLIVVEKPAGGNADQPQDRSRELRILTRDRNGSLILAKRSAHAIMCKLCGGAFGDPFAGITINGSNFTIKHYGGSRDRWRIDASFGYSRIDRTWQLTRVTQRLSDTLDLANRSTTVFLAGKQFGKVAIDQFRVDGDVSWMKKAPY